MSSCLWLLSVECSWNDRCPRDSLLSLVSCWELDISCPSGFIPFFSLSAELKGCYSKMLGNKALNYQQTCSFFHYLSASCSRIFPLTFISVDENENRSAAQLKKKLSVVLDTNKGPLTLQLSRIIVHRVHSIFEIFYIFYGKFYVVIA